MPYFASIFNNFTLSWDLGIVTFLFFAAFFYGFSAEHRKLALLLMSIYFAFVIITAVPNIQELIQKAFGGSGVWIEIGLFIGTVLAIFFLLAGSILRSSLSLPKREESQWWHLLLLSITSMGFLISSTLALFPVSYYNNLSTITKEIFVLNTAHFWWALAGVFTLIVLKKTKKKM